MDDDDPDAIWRSDDVPVAPPAEISLPADRSRGSDAITLDAPSPDGDAPAQRRVGPSVIVAGAVAAIVAVVAIVGVVASGSDESATPPTTEPSATTEPVDSGEEAPTPPPEAPTTTAPGRLNTPDDLELPPAVAGIEQPTEVVVLTQNGILHTLSLPSGRLRNVDLNGVAEPRDLDFGGIVVAPDATAIGVGGGSGVLIVPRSGEAINVDLPQGEGRSGTSIDGWVRADDGTTRFLMTAYPSQGNDFEFFTVDADGTVTELPVSTLPFGFGMTPGVDGDVVLNDAGGAYRVAADGTFERIEDGHVFASSGTHRLVRECDERLQCATVLVTQADGTRRVIDPAVLPEDFRQLTFNIALSPDGSAASMVRSTNQQLRVIVDFDSGEVAALPSEMWMPGSTWAGDNSGVFDVAQGSLQFIDRATGEAVAFGEELGPIISIGVRRPDAELPAEPSTVTAALTAARPIGPTGLVISAAGRTGGIGVVSIDRLELTTWRSPPLGRGPAALIVVDDGVLVLPTEGVDAFITTPTNTTTLGEQLTANGPVLPGPTNDTVWVPDAASRSGGVGYRLQRLDGAVAEDLGESVIDIADAVLLGSDGRGALVIERRGDVFVVGVDGASRLTSGELIAIGATTAYTRECDSLADCVVVRIDRATDARSPVDINPVIADSLGAASARGAALGSTVSPDGDVLVSQLPAVNGGLEPELQTVLLDIVTGQLTFVDLHANDQPVVWNDASSFAALLVESTVHVYDRAANDTVTLDGARLRSIGPDPDLAP